MMIQFCVFLKQQANACLLPLEVSLHLPSNPKQFKHTRRYTNNECNTQHEYCALTPNSNIPLGWREHLECGVCKQSITKAIGVSFLQITTCK